MADQAFFEGRQTQSIPAAHQVYPVSSLNVMGARMVCNPVGQVVVTEIVQDQNIGDYVRELRSLFASGWWRRAGAFAVGAPSLSDGESLGNSDTRQRFLTSTLVPQQEKYPWLIRSLA